MTYLKYFASVFIWQFLNPFGIWQTILQNGGQAIAILRSRISRIAAPHIAMSLPFSGYWTVVNGGVDRLNSHSWNLITQRYAYDFVFNGQDRKSDSGKADGFRGFGQDVLAPADGTVIKIRTDIRDYAYAQTGAIDILTRDMRGNYLIIRHAEQVYSFIAHLRRNSCTVKPGDQVKRGQILGQCGNSGHSTEPHIHFHVQDHPNFYLAIGLPIPFQNIEIEYPESHVSKKTTLGYISKNCRVRNFTANEKLPANMPYEISPAKGSLLSFFTSVLNALGLLVWIFFIYIWLIQPIIQAAISKASFF
ncbi:MAG: M23 family metallopeptidase [FCB group bacterium]|nr:M23 family metallopeptidase [FCB group bacterium]